MGSPLKDLYSVSFYNRLSDSLLHSLPQFNKQKFTKAIFDENFERLELKERMRHTAKVLHQFMPEKFAQAVPLLKKMIHQLQQDGFPNGGLEMMFFPDYIETYGIDDYENSVKAIEFVTQYISCEFAVRPFIIKYGNRMMEQMTIWSLHKSNSVRRLASEGSRPRLPWAMAVPALKKDPTPLLPILEHLKSDPSESVRRSVANNLNDIAKDHPALVIEIASRWRGISKEVDAIIKHGSRTLLKQGHAEILTHYGLESKNIELADFKILTPKTKIGTDLEFTFTVTNQHKLPLTVRLEYAVFYRKQNGLPSKKVFKISERIYQPNEKTVIIRRQKFKLITTRKFYAGAHQLSIIVNGQEKGIAHFELVD